MFEKSNLKSGEYSIAVKIVLFEWLYISLKVSALISWLRIVSLVVVIPNIFYEIDSHKKIIELNQIYTICVDSCYELSFNKLVIRINIYKLILIHSIIKMFATHKDDKKRVEKALELCGLPTGKNDTILTDKFTMHVFFTFYQNLVGRTEVKRIFEKL